MRILVAHNHYRTPGGEDAVVNAEIQLLRDRGHQVELYERHNAEIDEYSPVQKLTHVLRWGWSRRTYQEIRSIIRHFKPDVVHFHNIFFMISPSAYYACKDEGAAVVQSQHNFRLLCPNALFYRDHRVCEECLTRSLWRSVMHRCYKRSAALTAVVTSMIARHWRKRTWLEKVDVYVAAADFTRKKYIEGGIPADKIIVKPNLFYPDPGWVDQDRTHVLYAGRLSEEKGVDVLLQAWRNFPAVSLKIMGSGPLIHALKSYADTHQLRGVEFLGYVDRERYKEYMRAAKFIVVPSVCYENFPRIIVEAFAYGVPVLASRLGSLEEIVEDTKTGMLFEPQKAPDLSAKIQWMLDNEGVVNQMGQRARRTFEEKYATEINYARLMDIYQKAVVLSERDKHEANA